MIPMTCPNGCGYSLRVCLEAFEHYLVDDHRGGPILVRDEATEHEGDAMLKCTMCDFKQEDVDIDDIERIVRL